MVSSAVRVRDGTVSFMSLARHTEGVLSELGGVSGREAVEIEKFREVQKLLKEFRVLGIRPPGYNLAGPYERRLCVTE
jgi:hypothetical protein